MANMYNNGLENLGKAMNWGTTAFKVMLVTSTYTYDADHNFRDDITNEITNTGYTAGGNALDGETVIQDDAGDQAKYDATDEVFVSLAAGDLPDAAIVYQDVGSAGTDVLLAYCKLTAPPAPDGNNYTIVWSADGVFKISN